MNAFLVDLAFWVFAVGAVWTGYRVFRTDSMVRASFLLLASLVNVGAIMLLLSAEYLGFALIFMMALEMMVMALFMVMFMMNPAGLNPMVMVHQNRLSAAAGFAAFLGLSAVAVLAEFPDRPVPNPVGVVAQLGEELLGDSMLVFESVGVLLLATMIGAIALSSRRGRYGTADEGSEPPPLTPPPAGGER
ncbi:MAG: NADH-quinone oxidoreductase subunit J [Actinomycetota bacterium]|nr:NADH-quinone oxidoreductase subunit J [Actinomycetota bacterium]